MDAQVSGYIYLGNYMFCFSFNKKEEDFASLREYNDYLEEVESISMWTKCGQTS